AWSARGSLASLGISVCASGLSRILGRCFSTRPSREVSSPACETSRPISVPPAALSTDRITIPRQLSSVESFELGSRALRARHAGVGGPSGPPPSRAQSRGTRARVSGGGVVRSDPRWYPERATHEPPPLAP